MYRRGQSNLAINEYKEALQDFNKVLELEPSNKAAQNQIQICKHKIKEASDKEKKIYANMFTKLAAADKEVFTKNELFYKVYKFTNIIYFQLDIPSDVDVLSKCGKWTDEEKHEILDAFERDDNIVMI